MWGILTRTAAEEKELSAASSLPISNMKCMIFQNLNVMPTATWGTWVAWCAPFAMRCLRKLVAWVFVDIWSHKVWTFLKRKISSFCWALKGLDAHGYTAGPPVPLSRWARFYTQADESLGSPSSQDPMMTVDGLIHRSTFVVPFRLPTQAALQSGCAHFCIRCGWSFLRPHLLPQMYSGLEF